MTAAAFHFACPPEHFTSSAVCAFDCRNAFPHCRSKPQDNLGSRFSHRTPIFTNVCVCVCVSDSIRVKRELVASELSGCLIARANSCTPKSRLPALIFTACVGVRWERSKPLRVFSKAELLSVPFANLFHLWGIGISQCCGFSTKVWFFGKRLVVVFWGFFCPPNLELGQLHGILRRLAALLSFPLPSGPRR